MRRITLVLMFAFFCLATFSGCATTGNIKNEPDIDARLAPADPPLKLPIRNSTFNFTTPEFGGYKPSE